MNRADLKDYKHNQKWIKERIEYIEEYKNTISRLTSQLTHTPKANRKQQDLEAERTARLMDFIKELEEKILKENEKQKEILHKLDKIEQPYRLILEKVYIQGKSLVDVANEMNYSYREICRKNKEALNKFDSI